MKTPQELLQQALEVGECLLPDAPPGGRSAHPTVFVHGLLGWGAQDALYRAVPYWGLAAGDVLGYLNRCGYDCRAASVGIISSAWDRACELYAALTGGRADYGIAHAQRFDHARFGTAYPAPLVPGWGADRPIDLVGHSFGGATARPRPRVRRPRRCSPAAGPAGCTRWWPSPHRTTVRHFPTCSRMLRMRSRRCFSARRARSASRHSRTYMTSGSTSSASAATRTSRSRRPRCGCWRKTRSLRATTPLTTCAAPVRARSMRASPRCRTRGIFPSPAAGRCRACSRTTRSPTRP